MAISGNRRDGNPVLINPDGTASRLGRIPFIEKLFNEGWLNELVIIDFTRINH